MFHRAHGDEGFRLSGLQVLEHWLQVSALDVLNEPSLGDGYLQRVWRSQAPNASNVQVVVDIEDPFPDLTAGAGRRPPGVAAPYLEDAVELGTAAGDAQLEFCPVPSPLHIELPFHVGVPALVRPGQHAADIESGPIGQRSPGGGHRNILTQGVAQGWHRGGTPESMPGECSGGTMVSPKWRALSGGLNTRG